MTVRTMAVNATATDAEDRLHDMTDGSFEVIAVEVFDHPTSRWSNALGTTIGPWVLGPTAEVYERLAADGYEDFAVQYTVGRDREDA